MRCLPDMVLQTMTKKENLQHLRTAGKLVLRPWEQVQRNSVQPDSVDVQQMGEDELLLFCIRSGPAMGAILSLSMVASDTFAVLDLLGNVSTRLATTADCEHRYAFECLCRFTARRSDIFFSRCGGSCPGSMESQFTRCFDSAFPCMGTPVFPS
jgi:hypothetical protein